MVVGFVVAHVSDLHVSEFGDTFHDRLSMVRRSTSRLILDPAKHAVVWEEAGWRVVEERGRRRSSVILLDPHGFEHSIPSVRSSHGAVDPVERAAQKACRLEARRATVLSRHLPTAAALQHLSDGTPRNANIRLLRAARAIEEAGADAVVITGDLTDDGVGFELIEAAFSRWKERGMLFAVPGNHDVYLFPMRGSTRPRPTHASKRAEWQAFAERLGLSLHPTGSWWRALPDADCVLVGLDSCARPQRRFFRHNGSVGREQLAWLREIGRKPEFSRARHKIVLLHHHVVPLPLGVGRRAPPELGMRLDDATDAASVFNELGITAVLHGHRHVSEQRQPAGSNFTILASPSLTLGCRSGDAPSFWRIDLGEHLHAARVRVPVEGIVQDEDLSDPVSALISGNFDVLREVTIDVDE